MPHSSHTSYSPPPGTHFEPRYLRLQLPLLLLHVPQLLHVLAQQGGLLRQLGRGLAGAGVTLIFRRQAILGAGGSGRSAVVGVSRQGWWWSGGGVEWWRTRGMAGP